MNFFLKPFLLQLFLTLGAATLIAQTNNESIFYHRGISNNINANTLSTGNSGTGANIDVIYHNCNWIADPDDVTKTLKGNITTRFKTIAANVNTISFDFNNTSFNNDSLIVLYHNIVCNRSFPSSGYQDIVTITLPTTIVNIGTLDSLTIKYQGVPPEEDGNALGYQRSVDAASNNYIYTLSESYEDKDWWPCKADMQDKIDSIDINVTVPNSFWVAANGLLTDSSISGSTRTFKFKHRYPIASYLVSLAIAKYKRYNLGTLPVGTKNVPFVLNIFQGKSAPVEASILNYMNNHKLVFAALNNVFGDYPYANEKHGFYEFGFGGGMEHQTFSGIGGSSLQSNSILAHELGHQWFGDKVTFSSWNHLWLAEGFATYSEVLAAEFVPSLGISSISKLGNNKATARSVTSNATYINSIANSNSIWSSNNITAVYNRGCMVVSMLRTLLGDNKFFAACKSYLNDPLIAYKTATTADLQRNMEAQFGESMTGFFTEWVTKKGIPNYTVEWGNVGNKINIKLTQAVTASGSSGTAATFFPMPVVLKISDGSTDTTIVIYHKATNQLMYSGNGVGTLVNSNTISYNLSFAPTTVTFDPDNKTMANGTVSFSTILPITKAEIVATTLPNKNKITLQIVGNSDVEKATLQQSVDGILFIDFGEMELINPTPTTKQYQIFDNNNTVAKKYYRAKIYANNNNIFSNTIAVENKVASKKMMLSPNPAQRFLNVFLLNNNTTITLQLIDALGKIVLTKTTAIAKTAIETNSLSNGIYMLNAFENGVLIASEKVVIKK